ncbi:P-loop containing nucleoside triphosphate hydrolase protein [Catenaria anguillulae PL171]|uniref:Obg-like ATPase homolog n=1 Tax=Catenaria anguillulae PL171 TaxID=765915 RepID=A0A1Y2HC34_9FUNG|nr:P-loop containing nucleoside triphosphate hydrolase protein [Catenaria anguillulae PL171]
MPPKAAAAPAVSNEIANAARFGRVRNTLKMGVVGLPNVGKSSLFNLLTEQSAAAENYPFCTIEPNEARCAVPDDRYDYLVKLWNSPSCIPAYLMVTDIAGLIRGASEGQGLGNAFLSHIQAVDGIFHVIRAFENDDVIHVDDSVDPIRDLETIQFELCKKDLDIVEKAIAAEEAANRRNQGKKISPLFVETMDKLKTMLSENKPVRNGEWTTAEVDLINERLSLITTKPIIYLVNLTMKDYLRKKNKWLVKIHQWIQEHGGGSMIPFSVEFEQQLWDKREDPEAREAFLKESGAQSALPKIIKTGYASLDLIFYLTAGEKEVRAWTVRRGTLAPAAAGVIHTDFEKAFIKGEVVSFSDFKALCNDNKSMAPIKAAGKYRQEGKTYVVQDGDIIYWQIGQIAAPKKK